MRLIFKYSFFNGILLLSLSQISCPDLRELASIRVAKARSDMQPPVNNDMQPPRNVTNSRFVSLDSNGITLAWINPSNTDFSKVLIVRNTNSISDAPLAGQDYEGVDSIGGSSVVYHASTTTFIDRNVGATVISTYYYYKLFAYDASF